MRRMQRPALMSSFGREHGAPDRLLPVNITEPHQPQLSISTDAVVFSRHSDHTWDPPVAHTLEVRSVVGAIAQEPLFDNALKHEQPHQYQCQ